MSEPESRRYVDLFHTFAHPELIYAKRSEDGWDDGWQHERGADGWCLNCGTPPGVRHARLKRKASTPQLER